MSDAETYEVTIVKYGTLATSKSKTYLNFHLYHDSDAAIDMDYFFWIVRNEHRTVVVDTGFSRSGGDARGRTTLHDVRELMFHFGVDPSTSPDVIITHAHYDHIGNLSLFPTSTIYLERREFEFWNSRHAGRTMFHHSIEDVEIAHLNQVASEGRLVLFEDSLEVAPGISVETVGGHTPGQAVVKVRTIDGTVLLASDAVHFYEELERDRLFMSVSDLVAMYEGFDRISDLLESGEVSALVAGHDPTTLSRFTPLSTPFGDLAATIGARTS